MVEREQIWAWLATNGAIRSACDLDLLRFFTRHSHVLLTTDQIANFVGYSRDAIDEALEHLRAGGYVTRLKGRAADADLHIVAGGGGGDRASLSSLLELASTREGRLAIIDALPKPPRSPGQRSTLDATELSRREPAPNGGERR